MNKIENNLLEARTGLINEITQFSYDDFNKKPDPDKWSAAQVCLHLALAERSFTKAIVYGLKKTESNKVEPQNIDYMLDRKKKREAPEFVVPSSEPTDVHQVLELLNASRNDLLAVLSAVTDRSILKEKSVKHALFGELPLDQWLEMVYLHDQRHTEQIREIKQLLGI